MQNSQRKYLLIPERVAKSSGHQPWLRGFCEGGGKGQHDQHWLAKHKGGENGKKQPPLEFITVEIASSLQLMK